MYTSSNGSYSCYLLVFNRPLFFHYLLQFSNKGKEALISCRSQTLPEAMRYIKSHYKFVGIMTIVILALYPIIIIGAIAFGVGKVFNTRTSSYYKAPFLHMWKGSFVFFMLCHPFACWHFPY